MGSEIERHRAGNPARAADGTRQGSDRNRATGTAPGELNPEWVMIGVDVPAGKRLYASQHLKGSVFQLAVDEHLNGVGWHLGTVMEKMLVITKPTYTQCLAELMTIWRNWENEGRQLGPAFAGVVRALAAVETRMDGVHGVAG